MKLLPLLLLGLVGCAAPQPAAAPTASCSPNVSSPLQGAAVASVHPLVGKAESENKKFAFTRVVGAEVVLHSDDTAEALERRARCHAANPTTTDANDPLAVAGATVRVRARDGALAMQITASDPDAAREIVSRAERLPR